MSNSIAATHPASLKNQHRTRQLLAAWFIALVAASLISLLSPPAFGQGAAQTKYDVMEYQPNWFTEKTIVSRIKQIRSQIVNDPAQLDAQRDFFVKIYENIFASMTDPNEFANLQPRRAEVMKDIYNAARRGNARVAKGLTMMSFQKCEAIAKGNFYPGARINAVFMIGELNDRESNSLERQAPIAMQSALPFLLEVAEDAKYDDGLRVAALQGIQRHAALNSGRWKPELQDKVADLMISIVQSSAPKDRNADAHGWVQMIAINALVSLNNPRRADQVAKLILDLPTKADASQMVLVYAARATPMVQMPKDFKPQADAVLKRWAMQMVSSIAREAKRIEDFEKPRPSASSYGSSGMGMEMGGSGSDAYGSGMEMGMGMEMGSAMGMGGLNAKKPQTIEITLARRMLNDIIESFHLGLTGTRTKTEAATIAKGLVASLSDEQEKAQALRLVSIVDEVKIGVNDTSIAKNDVYAEKLRELEGSMLAFIDPTRNDAGNKGTIRNPFFDGQIPEGPSGFPPPAAAPPSGVPPATEPPAENKADSDVAALPIGAAPN